MSLLDDLELEGLTPARLWFELDKGTRTLAARSLYSHDWDAGTARREADQAIAMALRFREVTVRKLPVEKRIGHLMRSVRPSESLATSLLMALHTVERRALLETFLDTLEIPHEGGIIDDDYDLEPPSADRLRGGVDALRARFAAPEVETYLAALIAMDGGTWGALAEIAARQA